MGTAVVECCYGCRSSAITPRASALFLAEICAVYGDSHRCPNFQLQDYDHFNLEVGYDDGRDRVLLWLPIICKHVITDDSPLASWLKPSGIMADADASIVVVVSKPD